MNHILVTKEVSKSYGDHIALNNISLEIPENSIYGLLGPNGAGKTSLIRIINQITYPDTGEVFFNGELLKPEHIALIGYLPEERGLYKSMKVGEQVLYLAQLKGMSKSEAKKRLKYWFDKFEIGDWWNKKVQELSKGMAQKIQFIVTVLHEPKLLIFDEPFSGFDPINANMIKDEILDGRLSDIKKAYKKNIFEVGMQTEKGKEIISDLKEKFIITDEKYDSSEHQLNFTLQLATKSSQEVLTHIASKAPINHFLERIPTANDIFISTIERKNSNE